MAKKESTLFNMVSSLVVVTLIASTALGYVYELTKGPIAEAKLAKKIRAIDQVSIQSIVIATKIHASIIIVISLRQLVGKSLVAFDTGFSRFLFYYLAHFFRGTSLLLMKIHRCESMAIATLPRIGREHLFPDSLCQFQSLRLEFFGGINRPHEFMVQLIGSLNLAYHFR